MFHILEFIVSLTWIKNIDARFHEPKTNAIVQKKFTTLETVLARLRFFARFVTL